MPLTQQIFLVVVVVGFISLPLALLYGWIVTKGWEQTPPVVSKAPSATHADHLDDLPKAA